MTRSGFLSSFPQIAFCTLLLIFTNSCGKKAQIQYEAAQARANMFELQAQVKKLEGEIQGVGSLGRYNSTQKSHVTELKAQIDRLKTDLNGLKTEKEAVKSKVDALQKEIDDYRAKYRAA